MRIHFIRHGQIPSNVSGALDTAIPGPSLTETGRAQAQALVSAFEGTKIDSVWTSTAIRTQETAAPLAAARGLELNILDEFREIYAGELEMSLDPDHRHEYLNTITRWIFGELDIPLAGGTTGVEVLERLNAGFARIAETGHKDVAIVAHGALISFWSGLHCANLTEDLFKQYPVVNTGFVSAEPFEDRWRAIRWMGVELHAQSDPA